jgi:PAS domain S-box-containing protein
MSVDFFVNSLLEESENFLNLRDLLDFIKKNNYLIDQVKIYFDNNSRIFDIINNFFVIDTINYNYSLEINDKNRLLLLSPNNLDANLILTALKISIEKIKINKKKIEFENINNILEFSSNVSNFSTDEIKVLDYTLKFLHKIFKSESIFAFIYDKDEAEIKNTYSNDNLLGLGYLKESKLGIILDNLFKQKKSLLISDLNIPNEIYNSLGQLLYVFNKDKSILIPLYKEELKIGIIVLNTDNFSNFNEYYLLTNIGIIVSNHLYNIRQYNQLNYNNLYLSNLIKTSIDGIISLDVSGNIKLWNEGARNIFQYEEDEVKDKSLFSLFSSDTRLKLRSQWIEVLNGKSLNNIEGIAIKKNNVKFPVFYTLSLIKNDNQVIGVSIIVRDLTERKKLEKDILESKSRLQAIFDGLNAIIVLFSLENNILMANKEAIKLSNLAPKDLIGSNSYILLKEIKIKPLEIVKSSKKTFTIDRVFFESNEYNLKFIPVFDSIGNIISIILYAQKIKE